MILNRIRSARSHGRPLVARFAAIVIAHRSLGAFTHTPR